MQNKKNYPWIYVSQVPKFWKGNNFLDLQIHSPIGVIYKWWLGTQTSPYKSIKSIVII